MKVWSYTSKGRKPINEDYLLSQELSDNRFVCLVADGMGGYSHGDKAAKLVAENILALLSSQKHVDSKLIQIAINKANLALRQLNERVGEKSGSTLGGVYFEGNRAIIFWIGDVKILYYKNDILEFESRSHTLVNELHQRGIISDANKASSNRHVVTRSIQGDHVGTIASFFETDFNSGTASFVICSDGFPFNELLVFKQTTSLLEEVKSIFDTIKNQDDATVVFITT